nr:MAG TPA: hypothetical protein [Caudoviricetes sp.]DAT95319.1 MAG TPA: hypothetical protein [Caudoviricetes sp.]
MSSTHVFHSPFFRWLNSLPDDLLFLINQL